MTIDDLKAFGANTEEGLTRCFGNEGLFFKLIATVPSDANFDKLKAAAETGNTGDMFEAAHALKGALGNLSLTPMYDAVSDICESARAGNAPAPEKVKELLDLRDRLNTIVGQ